MSKEFYFLECSNILDLTTVFIYFINDVWLNNIKEKKRNKWSIKPHVQQH